MGIRAVFKRPNFRWQESTYEAIHRFCTQHIAQKIYKDYHLKIVKTPFKQTARYKKHEDAKKSVKN
jgi:hypothetical protein